jgi:hypothetical protein
MLDNVLPDLAANPGDATPEFAVTGHAAWGS